MTTETDIESGLNQMDYEVVDNGVIELPSSTPAVFEFEGSSELNVETLESELDEYEFSMFTPTHDTREDGSFYCYVDILTDHYKKIHLRIWREQVCVFPKEEQPDRYELSRLMNAVESAFGAELTHENHGGKQ